jgi:hypothetical protein
MTGQDTLDAFRGRLRALKEAGEGQLSAGIAKAETVAQLLLDPDLTPEIAEVATYRIMEEEGFA